MHSCLHCCWTWIISGTQRYDKAHWLQVYWLFIMKAQFSSASDACELRRSSQTDSWAIQNVFLVHVIIGGIIHLHIMSLFSDFNCSPRSKVKLPNLQVAPFAGSFTIDSGSMVSFWCAVKENKSSSVYEGSYMIWRMKWMESLLETYWNLRHLKYCRVQHPLGGKTGAQPCLKKSYCLNCGQQWNLSQSGFSGIEVELSKCSVQRHLLHG